MAEEGPQGPPTADDSSKTGISFGKLMTQLSQ
jgi:hypothetical protein